MGFVHSTGTDILASIVGIMHCTGIITLYDGLQVLHGTHYTSEWESCIAWEPFLACLCASHKNHYQLILNSILILWRNVIWCQFEWKACVQYHCHFRLDQVHRKQCTFHYFQIYLPIDSFIYLNNTSVLNYCTKQTYIIPLC